MPQAATDRLTVGIGSDKMQRGLIVEQIILAMGVRVMRPEDIRQFLRQEPFRPFRLTLTDGRTYDIRHPELVAIGRSSLFIGFPRQDDPEPVYDDYLIVSLLHIMQAQPVDTAESF